MLKSGTKLFIILIIFSFFGISFGTALGDLASSMTAGTWKKLASSGLTYDLIDAGNDHIILEYSENCVWDPNTEQVLFCGQGHYAAFKFIGYDAKTDAWRQQPDPPWVGGIGHSYDHNAIDAARGRFYFVKYSQTDIYEYNTATSVWRTVTSIPSSIGDVTCCKALAYFPEMNGLIVAGGGNVGLYNTTTGQWSHLASGLAMGIYEHFAEYSPVEKVVFFGGGAGDQNVYRLDAAGKVTKLADAPIPMGANQSTVTVDPVSGIFLVNSEAKEIYTFNALTDTWTKIYPVVPFRTFTTIATPISTYGVVLYFAGDYAMAPQVYIYKHAAGSAAEKTAPASPAEITSAPNPFRGTTIITLPGKNMEAKIYNASGKMVSYFNRCGEKLIWDASGIPCGVYMLKAKAGKKLYSKKLVLWK